MNSRIRLLLTLVLGLTVSACASGGGATPDPEGVPGAGAPNPAGRTFPPGTEPARNTWTRSAQVYLDQAENTDAADEKQRRYTEALEQARLSIQNQQGNPLGYYQAGIALYGLGQHAEAAEMFTRAEEIYPRYILETGPMRERAWVNLYNAGVQALQANDEARAIQQLELADQIYQGRPEARSNLAVIYTNRGDYDSAITWYERTLETLRGEDRQYKSAQVQAQWAEQEADIVFNMAQVYQRMDRRADAIRLYREYLAVNPNDASVKTHLALALSQEGQEDEAGRLYNEVLNSEGLADEDLYQIGIGLFNAGRFSDAATAFDRAVTANAYFRDAAFNLTQALMALANEREDASAPAAERVALYERLVRASEGLRGVDPSSRTAALVLAQAYRSLADLTSGATSTEWRNRLLAQLELIQDLPVDVSNVTLAPAGPGRIRMTGQVANLTMNPGSPINLRLSILGPGGTVLATQDVTVTAPAREENVSFSQEFQVSGEIAGWRYERI